MNVTELHQQLLGWRRHNDEYELSRSTIVDYNSYYREEAEVVASNDEILLVGKGKTFQGTS